MSKSKFDKLVEEGEALLKAMTAGDAPAADGAKGAKGAEGDEKIEAMAAEGGEGGEAAVAAAAADASTDGASGADDGAGDEEQLGKSFEVVLPGGEKVQAVDGGALVKTLLDQNKALLKSQQITTQVLVGIKKTNDALTEANKKQGEQIGELKKSLDAIATKPAGRKSVVNVHDAGKGGEGGEQKGMEPREFMAKALQAQVAGRITAHDVARAENYIGKGMQVPDDLVRRVVGA